MTVISSAVFDPAVYLAQAGRGRQIVELMAKDSFFCQGDKADAVFYLQKGTAKLTVVSRSGKEVTTGLMAKGQFIGENSLAANVGQRLATATAVIACTALRIERDEMVRVMHDEPAFLNLFLGFLLIRSVRAQADFVDQLINSSERRLARILLLMAQDGRPDEAVVLIPPVSQEALADMIGTTRSRVCFFMNRFRKLGYVEYNGRVRVCKSLLKEMLHDEPPEHNLKRPTPAEIPHWQL